MNTPFMTYKEENEHLRARVLELERDLAQYRNVPTHPVVMRDRRIAELEKKTEYWRDKFKASQPRITELARQIAELEKERDAAREEIQGAAVLNGKMFDSLIAKDKQIAALELEVARLRSVMADVIKAHGYEGGTPIEAISTPFNPTALNELIEKVERLTIDRHCAELERLDYWYSSRAIRALPVGQIKLEDLK